MMKLPSLCSFSSVTVKSLETGRDLGHVDHIGPGLAGEESGQARGLVTGSAGAQEVVEVQAAQRCGGGNRVRVAEEVELDLHVRQVER